MVLGDYLPLWFRCVDAFLTVFNERLERLHFDLLAKRSSHGFFATREVSQRFVDAGDHRLN